MLNGNRMKSMRTRHPRDFYETPLDLADEAFRHFHMDEHPKIDTGLAMDAGCGSGIWGKALCSQFVMEVHGVDIEPKIANDNADYYNKVFTYDFLNYKNDLMYDIVYGNPPYSLAEKFIRHSFELIKPYGYIFFLLRLSFLEGIERGKTLFRYHPLKRVYVCSRRPSFFSSDGEHHTTDTLAYAMFLWQKCYVGKPEISFLDWSYSK